MISLVANIYCLPTETGGDDPLLPEGTPIRDLWRGEDHGVLGVAWRLLASLDGGETWRVFETMWDDEEPLPVALG